MRTVLAMCTSTSQISGPTDPSRRSKENLVQAEDTFFIIPDPSTSPPEYEFLRRAYASAEYYNDGKYAYMKKHLPLLVAKGDFGARVPWSHDLKLLPTIDIWTADDTMKIEGKTQLHVILRSMGVVHRDVGMNNIMIFHAGAETIGVLIDHTPSTGRATLE
ncbi:hypothetical protein BS47DRAFT_1485020 [Hydnum rufescens UP504]|uniref:Uncharacterized protein n=1 Tax=Hydnum rufescens UP504 TaxID=1448309 RepID=A0A9P6DTT8_9AGAM|nr:hypothetical protein BS47DRAFT_1485020 [Hydnum rufescens UP504]